MLQIGKEDVGIDRIEPVGNYAVRLYFDDGHDTGLYSWQELQRFCTHNEQLWADYLSRLAAAAASLPDKNASKSLLRHLQHVQEMLSATGVLNG